MTGAGKLPIGQEVASKITGSFGYVRDRIDPVGEPPMVLVDWVGKSGRTWACESDMVAVTEANRSYLQGRRGIL